MIGDFLRAAGQLADPRFAGVLVRALALTLGLLAALSAGAVALVGLLPAHLGLPLVGEVAMPFMALRGLALGGMVWLSGLLMFPVAALFVGLYLDQIADAVEARHYPGLPPPRRTGLAEDLLEGLGFLVVMLAVNLVALVAYLLAGPLAPLVFWAVNGYLFSREYFALVAARRIDPVDARHMRRRHAFRIWLAGALMAVPLSLPVANLIVPLLGVVTYVHIFHRLARRQAAK